MDETTAYRPTLYYIANCINRILATECVPAKAVQRANDLAEATSIAAHVSLTAAHRYLAYVCKEAEAGKYTSRRAAPEAER